VGSGRCRCPARWACRDDPWRLLARVVSHCASAAGWAQMRCHECAAEVTVRARVCSRCGAPIIGQQPPVVADTVTGAVSDAAGKAVAARVAEQPQEPYVPGSGAKVPAGLRLVQAGYGGIAFAGALACAAAAAFSILFDASDDPTDGLLFFFLTAGAWLGGLYGASKAFKARIRFSRLLRRPSDPRTATVMASTRGGRTLILDIIPRDGTGHGYQSLSEVRLALRTKTGMLVPGETVNVYGGSGGKSELLISSPQRGRAFLGTVTSQSALEPRLLDEKVSGATLIDWAAWAASTTFSSTGLRLGYDKPEVDAFRSAVRDTFLGGAVFWVSTPPVKSDDLRGKQFSTHRPGYDKTQVAAFLEAASIRLAAMESTDRPAGPLVSDALLVAWAEWADSTTFSKLIWRRGYSTIKVDAFRKKIRNTFLGTRRSPVKADKVRGKQFSTDDDDYDKKQVDAFLDAAGIRLAAMEATYRPQGPLVSGAIHARWAKWADSKRFSTSRLRVGRYDTAEVDAFREAVRDAFLGVSRSPLTWRAPPGKQFTTTRRLRPGYDPEQVDAFLNKAEPRLAAMRATDNGAT
jgi:DivIVA domain-containing protein